MAYSHTIIRKIGAEVMVASRRGLVPQTNEHPTAMSPNTAA